MTFFLFIDDNYFAILILCYLHHISFFVISLIKLNFNIRKNDLDQMGQVYLMNNNVPILVGHKYSIILNN